MLGILEGRLADRIGDELVLVQPDSLDGVETLLDKQAYLQDLRDRMVTLDRRLGERAESVRRERAIRDASAGFTDEARFLDEGGRVGSDDSVRLRGASSHGWRAEKAWPGSDPPRKRRVRAARGMLRLLPRPVPLLGRSRSGHSPGRARVSPRI